MITAANFPDLCRTCGMATLEEDRHNIFGSDHQESHLPLKLALCVPVLISEEDCLPKVLCGDCLESLCSLHNFQEKSKSTETYLNNILKSMDNRLQIKEEPENTEYCQNDSISKNKDINVLDPKSSKSVQNSRQEGFGVCEPLIVLREAQLCSVATPLTSSPWVLTNVMAQTQSKQAKKFVKIAPKRSLPPRAAKPSGKPNSATQKSIKPKISCIKSQPKTKSSTYSLPPPPSPPPLTSTGKIKKTLYQCTYCKLLLSSLEASCAHVTEVHGKERQEKGLGKTQINQQQMPKEILKSTQLATSFEKNSSDETHFLGFESISVQRKCETVQKSKGSGKLSENSNLGLQTKDTEAISSKSQHMDKSNKQQSVPLETCNFCKIAFANNTTLQTHISDEHKKEHECTVCKYRFNNSDALVDHMQKGQHRMTESNEKWMCGVCGKKFNKKYNVQTHMKIHTGERLFPCTICNKAFFSPPILKAHMKRHTKAWSYICSYCGKGFYEKHELEGHVRTHHTKEKPFSCDQCSKSFAVKQSLRQHCKEAHELKQSSCDICGKTFRLSNSLRGHMLTHTIPLQERKKHKCSACDASFISKGSLRHHIRSHTGELPYECHLCHKRFSTKKGLELHLVIHSGVKSYVCEVCGKAFAAVMTLKVHRRTHTGERPYECDICHKWFTQRSSMTSHRRLHIDRGQLTPHMCSQ